MVGFWWTRQFNWSEVTIPTNNHNEPQKETKEVNQLTILFAHNCSEHSSSALDGLDCITGARTEILFNADQALRWIKERRPDGKFIVILNNHMVHGDELSNAVTYNGTRAGEAVLEHLRRIPGCEETPIVIITTQREDVKRMQELSDPYLVAILAETPAIDVAVIAAVEGFFPAETKNAQDDPFEPREWGRRFAGNPSLGN